MEPYKNIGIPFGRDDYRQARAAAGALGVSMSELARRAIRDYITRLSGNGQPEQQKKSEVQRDGSR